MVDNMKSFKQFDSYEYKKTSCEFLLSEFFNPREIEFGTNFPKYNDNNITKTGNDKFYNLTTYFNIDNRGIYKVIISNFNKIVTLNFMFSIYSDDASKLRFTNIPLVHQKTEASIYTLNWLIYIFSEILKKEKENIEIINFSPAPENEKLKPFYDAMVQNKSFINLLKSYGFIFDQNNNDEYSFKKVDS